VAILEQPQGCYKADVYWRPDDCRKTVIETSDLILAKIVVLGAMENFLRDVWR
jgi:hypothetical protein